MLAATLPKATAPFYSLSMATFTGFCFLLLLLSTSSPAVANPGALHCPLLVSLTLPIPL